MSAAVVMVAVVLALTGAASTIGQASEPRCPLGRGAPVAHLTAAMSLLDTPRGTVVGRYGPETKFLHTATVQWHDGSWWWLMADTRGARAIGWVPAKENVKVVDCGLDLLLEIDGGKILKEGNGIIIRGKIPLTKDR